MIVASPPGGAQFFSNDGQLFCDGDVTIYSPAFLPEDTVLTSTTLRVALTVTPAPKGVSVQVTDADSGYRLWERSGLTLEEAYVLMEKAIDEYAYIS